MNAEFTTALFQALAWSLVHVVWQITILALLLALLLPRLKNAQQRYWSAFASLFSTFGVFVGTFVWIFLNKYETTAANLETTTVSNTFFQGVIATFPTPDFLETLDTWLEQHTSIVVMCWLLGFTVSLFRLLGGVYYLHRLQRNSHSPTTDYWQEKIAALAKHLGLARPVELLESVLVKSPMALGYFKPIIFFPVGLLNHLSPAEVEAILAHELAHIARRDWLFNLLQAFIETLFYFHPAIWWLSSVVRAERENCCDDTAVQLTGNRVMLAKALLHLQQLHAQHSVPVLALGAKGRAHFSHRFSLLTRIQRILNQPSQQKSLIMEKFVTTVFLLGILVFVGVRANGSPQLEAFKTALSETPFEWWADLSQTAVANDSVPKPPRRVQKVTREENGKRVEMEAQDGEVTRLNIDGKEIPANELDQHRALTNDLIRDVPPVPPFPPVPPVPGVPPVPPVAPMPPAPNEEGMSFRFDGPGSVSRLSTTNDSEGNTVIRLEREGKPVEIKVKNGEVWVDGARVENGSSLELSAPDEVHVGHHENYLIYSGEPGKDGNFYYNNAKEMEIQSKEYMKLSEKDRAKQEKEFQKAQKEMQKAQKEMEKQQRIMEEQHRKMEAEMRDRHRSAQ